MINGVRNFLSGVGMLGRGFGLVTRTPRLLLLGALPALLTSVLLLGAIAALVYYSGDLAALVTPFADDWAAPLRALVRVAAGVAVVALALTVSMLSFTGIALAIGGPFYEAIAERVEDDLGGVPESEEASWWRSFSVGLGETALLVLIAVLVAIPLFLIGLIPVVGSVLALVLGVLVNGWLLGLEMTAVPFGRRGRTLGERHRCLRRNRMRAWGFALPTYLLLLVPFAALLVMPAALAGGTLVAHRALTEDEGATTTGG
ncbi:EI24 domain-containing protein [Actinoalloteichus caeruleus]|uniref:CysZ protein n=1 Tax=Actinoalloteichus caeruleus DSM 43889 TaxID=1120930 RepID=A0ABT1JNI6_ACTCY|nr:EI24 domain-containing protein [Actinoalloteichus caeruleus]MCP2334089.1 CysZ protein [Actinoalloteichus caeruleus DSM 43889]